jgi:hypothetical protein
MGSELLTLTMLQQNASPSAVVANRGLHSRLDEPMASPTERSIVLFVWGTWVGMFLVALAVVAIYGRNIPFAEDWFLVPPLTGNEPSLFAWIWTQNSEHLVPLPKAILLLLLTLSGGDFRVGMLCNTFLLGTLAGGMILVARHVRGRISVTDAFFPIVLLHIGHWDNLLWSWQIQFVLSTALTGILLLMIVAWHEGPATPAAAIAAAICLVSLPLSGGNGTIVAPAFAVWSLCCGLLRARHEACLSDRITGLLLISSAALALLIVMVYLIGYQRPTWYPASPNFLATAITSIKFMAFGFGPAAKSAWFLTSLGAISALLITVAALLAKAVLTGADDRRRVLGLMLVAGALAALAFALGWGRAGKIEASGHMSTRYALLSVPMLCAAYFSVELYASRSIRRLTHGALFVIVVVLLPLNTMVGLERRNWFERGFASYQVDLHGGIPVNQLAERHYKFLMPWSREQLAAGMEMLRQACLGPFSRICESILLLPAETSAVSGNSPTLLMVDRTDLPRDPSAASPSNAASSSATE